MLSSFKDLDLKTIEKSPDAPTDEEKVKKPLTPKQSQRGVEDLLGQPSGKFDYKVFYIKPPSFNILIELIMPRGWDEEFDDEDSPNEKAIESLTHEDPQQGAEDLLGQYWSKFDDEKLLDKKETCTVEVWKDKVMETVTEEMQE